MLNCLLRRSFWVLVLSILINSQFTSEGSAEGNLSIRAFLMQENKACAPSGYGRGRCKKWDADDAEVVLRASPIFSQFKIPPGTTIELGGLRQTLENYFDFSCRGEIPCAQKTTERSSLVLLFEWDTPQTGVITFRRNANPPIKSYNAVGRLDNELRWLNHQRAEYFLPRHGFQWELKLGSKRYILNAR